MSILNEQENKPIANIKDFGFIIIMKISISTNVTNSVLGLILNTLLTNFPMYWISGVITI